MSTHNTSPKPSRHPKLPAHRLGALRLGALLLTLPTLASCTAMGVPNTNTKSTHRCGRNIYDLFNLEVRRWVSHRTHEDGTTVLDETTGSTQDALRMDITLSNFGASTSQQQSVTWKVEIWQNGTRKVEDPREGHELFREIASANPAADSSELQGTPHADSAHARLEPIARDDSTAALADSSTQTRTPVGLRNTWPFADTASQANALGCKLIGHSADLQDGSCSTVSLEISSSISRAVRDFTVGDLAGLPLADKTPLDMIQAYSTQVIREGNGSARNGHIRSIQGAIYAHTTTGHEGLLYSGLHENSQSFNNYIEHLAGSIRHWAEAYLNIVQEKLLAYAENNQELPDRIQKVCAVLWGSNTPFNDACAENNENVHAWVENSVKHSLSLVSQARRVLQQTAPVLGQDRRDNNSYPAKHAMLPDAWYPRHEAELETDPSMEVFYHVYYGALSEPGAVELAPVSPEPGNAKRHRHALYSAQLARMLWLAENYPGNHNSLEPHITPISDACGVIYGQEGPGGNHRLCEKAAQIAHSTCMAYQKRPEFILTKYPELHGGNQPSPSVAPIAPDPHLRDNRNAVNLNPNAQLGPVAYLNEKQLYYLAKGCAGLRDTMAASCGIAEEEQTLGSNVPPDVGTPLDMERCRHAVTDVCGTYLQMEDACEKAEIPEPGEKATHLLQRSCTAAAEICPAQQTYGPVAPPWTSHLTPNTDH